LCWLFTHFFRTYRAGKAIVRNEHDTPHNKPQPTNFAECALLIAGSSNASAMNTHAAIAAAEQRNAIAAANNVKREAVLRAGAAGALDAADRLRDELDLTQRFAGESADAAAKSIAALRAVFESCTKEYRGMAEIAQGHANDAMTLQEAWPE
jgi:hypothetical protein